MSETAAIKPTQAGSPSRRVRRRLGKIINLEDFETEARRHLPPSLFAYVSSGTQSEVTLRENRTGFDRYRVFPRVLAGMESYCQKTALFGVDYGAPFGVAPMGLESLVSYRGDIEIAIACQRARIPFIQSGASLIRLEDLRKASDLSWFQAYVPKHNGELFDLIDRVDKAGFETLVLTVDMKAGSNPERIIRSGFSTPIRPTPRTIWEGVTHPRWTFGTFLKSLARHGVPHFENLGGTRGPSLLAKSEFRSTLRLGQNWETVRVVRDYWKGRLVLKGLLHPLDVARAVQMGIDGVIISTHGGRQIDGVITAIEALPDCVAAANGMPVMIDSGIRRGTDIIKCIALGASFVFIGRPFNYAATLGGRAGVAHAIGLLARELERDMGNMGLTSIPSISRECIIDMRRGN